MNIDQLQHFQSLGAQDATRAPPQAAVIPRRSMRERLDFLLVYPINIVLKLACARYRSFLVLFELLSPQALEWIGKTNARAAFHRAARRVPAYARFLAVNGYRRGTPPETDKDSYIKPYRIEDRCVGGRFPTRNLTIDESSGSTGTPYNWVRCDAERHQSHIVTSYFARYCFGSQPFITINAFSMGAWATGINMGAAMGRNGTVKSTGPDIDKILHTLQFLGPSYRYLIAGYPPFLKHLIDAAAARNFPLQRFDLRALVGGEGMAEGLREYLLQRFQSVYSGFGATDLEIGIAGETPLAAAIRRLCHARPEVRAALFGTDSRLPMLFQYNPLMHHIEVNEQRELVFTISRKSLLSPRIRYNVHDEGGVARFDEMEQRLADAGVDMQTLRREAGSGSLRLPFVWVYGRRDHTISVMGANIYPEDLEQCLYAEPELARITHSFCLGLAEGESGAVNPRFLFEVDAEPSAELALIFRETILRRLLSLNADYREAWKEYPQTVRPVIELHRLGTGPFAVDSTRIKQIRLLKAS